MSKKRKLPLLLLPVFLLILLCFLGRKEPPKDPLSTQSAFDSFMNEVFCLEVQNDSITLNYTLSNPSAYGITPKTVTLGSYGREASLAYLSRLENYETNLKSFSYRSLNAKQQQDYDIFLQYIQSHKFDPELIFYGDALGPNTGIQAQLPILLSEYHFNTKEDIDTYLSILSEVKPYFEQIIAFEQEKSEAGLFMSDHTADEIINQCQNFTSSDENAMIQVFNQRIDAFDWLNDSEKEFYKKENQTRVENEVLHAYELLIQNLKALKGTGTNPNGLSHYEYGKKYYEYLVRTYTGSSRSIKKIQKGLREVIDKNILNIRTLIEENPDLLDSSKELSAPCTNPEEILSFLQKNISSGYPDIQNVSYEIKYVPDSLEEYLSPAFYLTPQIDEYTKNCIYINNYNQPDSARLFTTLAHEGYPGHLFQSVCFYEQNPIPLRTLLSFPGYTEGWATYAEFDSYQYLEGNRNRTLLELYNQIILLCMYADTDIGINYYGWDYKKTKDYLERFGIRDEESVSSIFYAMIEEPGIYLKYAVGYYEIQALEEKLQKKLGASFSQKEFREYLLHFGPAPFDVIGKYIKKEL